MPPKSIASGDGIPLTNYAAEDRLRNEERAWRVRAKAAEKAGDAQTAERARQKETQYCDNADGIVAERQRLQVAYGVAVGGGEKATVLDMEMRRAFDVWSINGQIHQTRKTSKKRLVGGYQRPRDPEFPGVDKSPVPPLPNPLPGIEEGSEYANFNADKFVKHVANTMTFLGAAVPRILDFTWDPAIPTEQVNKVAPFLNNIRDKVHALSDLIEALYPGLSERTWLQGRSLAPFFDGPLPDPLPKIPDEAGSAIALAIFPRVYPFIRLMGFTFISSPRRQKWMAIDPAVDPWDDYFPNIDARKFDMTRRFNVAHFHPLWGPLSTMLFTLAKFAPVCQRIADDPLFLGAVLDGICLIDANVNLAYGDPNTPLNNIPKFVSSFLAPLTKITLIAAENKAAWRSYVADRGRYGDSIFVLMPRLFARVPWTMQKELKDMAIEVITAFHALCGPLFPWESESLEPTDQYFTSFRKLMRQEREPLPNRCDGCGVFTSSKLQRCSRCRIARYCSAECLKKAWSNEHGGHKNGCTKVVMPEGIEVVAG